MKFGRIGVVARLMPLLLKLFLKGILMDIICI